ncbi:MAG: lysophospholipid acyltransferase family protein [Anaerolineales bacterium]
MKLPIDDTWPADERNGWNFSLHRTRTRALLTFSLRQILRPIVRFEGHGVEHVPRDGPLVLVSNHLSNYDVILMEFVLPRANYYMAKIEIFSNPLLGWVYRRLGAFPVERGAKDAWAMRYALFVLESGKMIGMFPEGTRSKEGRLKPGKTGAARLAIESGAPVVPMAIYGTENILRPWYRRPTVHIAIGEPLHVAARESPMELTDRIMYAIAALLPKPYRGVYAQPAPV